MYRWAEHTGELELEIQAQAEDEVYAEALRAVAELLGEDDGAGPAASDGATEHRHVAVEARDRARLLAELVGELAFLAETERFVPVALERLAADGRRLEATVRGRVGEPPPLVKAVTYHRLAFEPADGGWRARLVLDV